MRRALLGCQHRDMGTSRPEHSLDPALHTLRAVKASSSPSLGGKKKAFCLLATLIRARLRAKPRKVLERRLRFERWAGRASHVSEESGFNTHKKGQDSNF